MTLEVTQTDDLYLPDDALLRSSIGASGTVEGVFAAGASDRAIESSLRGRVGVEADEGGVTDIRIVASETGGDGRHITAEWDASLWLSHPQSWGTGRIEVEAEEMVTVDGGEVKSVDYSHSRPAHETATENWVRVTEDSAFARPDSGSVEQWVHEKLLVIAGVTELEVEGEAPVYAVVQLAPPVPSPYEMAHYWAYGQRRAAETDLRRYMLSIDGAFEAGVESPVETAREAYEFNGSVMNPEEVSAAALEDNGELREDPMASLPNRPLTRGEVGTIVDSYNSITGGGCRLLLPTDPLFVDEMAKRAQHVTEGDCVSFTISTPDGFVVFELEDRDEGLRWFRMEGELEE